MNLTALFDDDVRARRDAVERKHFAGIIDDVDLWMQIFFVFDDHRAHQAGCFIKFTFDCDAFDQVIELHCAGNFGQDRYVVWIPLNKDVTLLYLATVWDGDFRTDHNCVAFKLSSFVIENCDLAVLIQHDPVAFRTFDCAQILIPDCAVIFRFDLRLLEHLARRAADMERPHRQLCAWFANGLRSNNADCLSNLHRRTGG